MHEGDCKTGSLAAPRIPPTWTLAGWPGPVSSPVLRQPWTPRLLCFAGRRRKIRGRGRRKFEAVWVYLPHQSHAVEVKSYSTSFFNENVFTSTWWVIYFIVVRHLRG